MSTELEIMDKEIEEISKELAIMGEPTTAEIVEAMKPNDKPFSARKIAIVGFAETSYKLAPWGDPEWEIWGLNGLHKVITWTDNITRWFQIHPKESVFGEGLGGGADHVKFLQSLKIPVFMTQHYDEIPMSVPYPLKEICEWFSIGREKERHPYLSNTISEMLALLAYEIVIGGREVDEIGVWGVDMAHCVAPETKILTADLKWIPAEEIKPGDKLIGYDECNNTEKGNRAWKSATVEKATRLIEPCYKLTMEDGSTLIASADHRWLCNSVHTNCWRVTKDLIARGDYCDGRSSHIIKPLKVWEEDKSYEAGYLAAAFDGEGHISQTPNNCNGARINLGFSQRENGMSNAVEEILKRKNFVFNRQEGKEHESRFGANTYRYYISGGKCEVLRFLGQMRPKRLLEKFNPDMLGIMRSINRIAVIKKEFIGDQEVIGLQTSTGTFIAEGFASHNSTEYQYQKNSCEFYLGIFEGYRQIMEIFKRTGIVSGIMEDGAFKAIKLPFPTKWHLPKESLLLYGKYIYGYEEVEDEAEYKRLQARRQILVNNRNSFLTKEQEAHDAQMQFLGAMQEMDNEIKNRGY
jgi:hypothetical protein